MAHFVAQLDADRAPQKTGAAYICGPLNGDGRRCAAGALPRGWVAADLDGIEAASLPAVLQWAGCYDGFGWLTHSSTPEVPRMRIIFGLQRPADRDECIALGARLERELHGEFGDKVKWDGCTFRPEHPVHVPPTGAQIHRFNGAPLDVPAASTAAAESAVCTEEHRRLQKPSSVSSVSSVQGGGVSVGGVSWTIPPDTIPTEPGKRNDCLFALARHVKGIKPAPTHDELRRIVRAWHELALPAIQTLDFAVSFGEFMHGYERVKQPHGAVMDASIANIDNTTPLPVGIEHLGYGEACNQLVRICVALQAHEGDGPFFLGARKAGELIGEPFTDANRMMQALVLDGVIEVVTKGAGKKASRYRFVWPAASEVRA